MRASFGLWRDGGALHYVMYNRGDARTPQEVVEYPMGSLRINELMPPLLRELQKSDELRAKVGGACPIQGARGVGGHVHVCAGVRAPVLGCTASGARSPFSPARRRLTRPASSPRPRATR